MHPTGFRTTGIGASADDDRFAATNIPEPLRFDLATDPNETTNISAQNPKKARDLAAQLKIIKGATAKPGRINS
jgi:hypothetical protein